VAQPTSRYRFEFRLHDWAERLGRSLCGEPIAFFVGLRDDGSPRRIYFAGAGSPIDGPAKAALAEAYQSWFLYLPHDEGSAYLEWLGLEQAVAERWLGKRLDASDFLDVRQTGTREGWPDSWRVIVG
jgi:hypothetical protein